MGFKTQSIFTKTFTDTTFNITEILNLTIVSINLISGVATILGTNELPSLTPSTASMQVGQPILLQADNGYLLDGITIDSTAGGVFEVIAK